MSDLGIGLCWGSAFVVFILFDIWVYFYAKRKQEIEDQEWREIQEMIERQKRELISKGLMDEYGNFIKKEDDTQEKKELD